MVVEVEVVVVGDGVGRNLLDVPMLRRGELLVLELNLRTELEERCEQDITWRGKAET